MPPAFDLQEAALIYCNQRSSAGPRLGLWLTAPCQWSVMFGLAITYTVTAGQSFQVDSCLRILQLRAPATGCSTSRNCAGAVTLPVGQACSSL